METCSKVSGGSEKTIGAAKRQSGYQKCSQANQHKIRIALVEYNDDRSSCHSRDKNPDNRCSTPLCIMCYFRPFLERFQQVLNFLFPTQRRESHYIPILCYISRYAILRLPDSLGHLWYKRIQRISAQPTYTGQGIIVPC